MKLLRWILFLPGATAASLLGAFLGYSAAAALFGDTPMQTSAAFLGTVAFIAVAGIIVPTHRNIVTITIAAIVTLVAIAAFLLSVFTTRQPYATMSPALKVLIPVTQILACIYAVFGVQRLFTKQLEPLIRKINQLGVAIVSFGLLVTIIGLIAGVSSNLWFGFAVGLCIIALGVVTWLVPRIRIMVIAHRHTGRWQWSIRVRPAP